MAAGRVLRLLVEGSRAQFRLSRRNIEDFLPVLTMPLFTLAFMAILDQADRRDLAAYALIAPLLLTIGQMGIFVASEMITRERSYQTLELLVASPAPFALLTFARILSLSLLGVVGLIESWALAVVVFNADIQIHHPVVLAITLALTILGATGAALVASGVFCFSRSPRTLQNSVAFPLFVVSGVLVPVSYLPDWLEPLSRLSFLYWSAELLRNSLQPDAIEDLAPRLLALFSIGILSGAIGAAFIGRMLNHLIKEGELGL